MGTDAMTLDFDGFQVAVLFVAVLLVNYLIGGMYLSLFSLCTMLTSFVDGKSHWLEGWLLQCLYL